MSTIKVDTVRPVTTDGSLTLQGDSSGSGVSGITIDSSGNTTLGGNLVIPDDGTIGSANDTDAITIDSSGNVGVGTTTALSKLTALGASSTVTNTASTRSPVASLRGGNNNNRLDFYVDNTGATSIMGLGAYNTAGGGTAMAFYTGASVDERMRIDNSGNLKFDSGYGSAATAYGCRAWVNFNGTGTVAIRANGNVSSITDNGTGDYTVNFTTAMPDANYAVIGTPGESPISYNSSTSMISTSTISTSSIRIINRSYGTNALADLPYIFIAVFR